MSYAEWGLLALTCLAGASSPGPSLALLMRSVIRDGRLAGVVLGLAHGAGILLYAGLVTAGLGAALLISPLVLNILQALGAVFLFWVASLMIRAGLAPAPAAKADTAMAGSSRSLARHGFDGFMIVFLNPKIAAFFLAIFSQFLEPGQGLALHIGMAVLAWLIDTGWYIMVAVILAFPPVLLRLQRHQNRIELAIGTVLLVIGLGLVGRMFTAL